jgi:exosome complex exonuclease RRP6
LAALELGFEERGLNSLLEKYCEVKISKKLKKQYQRADWRLRPLPDDMIHYARQDTHYLLYIYDVMKNELLEPPGNIDTLLKIYNESSLLCLQVTVHISKNRYLSYIT